MKFVLYAHSVVSDWNNGNAHFLRGILSDLERRGHSTQVLEPENGWSRAKGLPINNRFRVAVGLEQWYSSTRHGILPA
jgi:spore maturation protein CgeB